MKKITDFFWFCSGAHIELLKKYPTEHNKFVGIGATIFFTALFASLSGGYAMYFVFAGNPAAPVFAIIFGLLWGLAIFNMDRYIVSSIKKTGSSNHQIMQALPRILLAIMIGIVISRPLELKIFDKEIKQKLKTSYLNGQRDKIDTLNKAFSNKYQLELAKSEELKTEKDSLEKDINRSRYVLNQEVFGDKTNQTSGVIGFGTYAKQKQSVIDQKEQRLVQVRSDLQSLENIINRRKELEGLNSTRLFNEKELDSLANIAGFADRNYALGQLSFNPDGTRDVDTYLAVSFISFLFILLECLPVFVKLMSDKGPYDVALENVETVAIHHSERNREHEVTVSDNIQDTLNETEASKRKTFIERRAKKDLEDFED